MRKSFFVFICIFATGFGFAYHERHLVLPLHVEAGAEEPWEGLALMLALQNRATNRAHLVPFTAVRKKLNEYGLGLTTRTSLATKLRLAKDLAAEVLVFGTMHDGVVQVTRYHLNSRELERRDFPVESYGSPAALLTQIAAFVDLPTNAAAPEEIEIGRLWASTYFAEDLNAAQSVLDKLVDHGTVGWLFVQEYLDRFGDPLIGMEADEALVSWRDIFAAKDHDPHALIASQRLLEKRNYPRDLLIHAKILNRLDRHAEACDFAKRAEQFGSIDADAEAILSRCEGGNTTRYH